MARTGFSSMKAGWQRICIFFLPTANCPPEWYKPAPDIQEDDLFWYSKSIAFIIEDAAGLPPFLPTFVMNGTSVSASSSLDSGAETKPTGIPTTSAGQIGRAHV